MCATVPGSVQRWRVESFYRCLTVFICVFPDTTYTLVYTHHMYIMYAIYVYDAHVIRPFYTQNITRTVWYLAGWCNSHLMSSCWLGKAFFLLLLTYLLSSSSLPAPFVTILYASSFWPAGLVPILLYLNVCLALYIGCVIGIIRLLARTILEVLCL